ncbi:hypothetical protein SAMN05192558_105264 [Actinokineospora alba]|uniref:Secreted protein n=1 Tax=Actinokineospora alba TaxID=504798 RepID=A0A1H0N9N0_9PSEU|nr:hypothetical protein [Actinokineospora alba]TDP68635.1 hypothetical protein C8E96_4200 [Actinokineospora alba]SDH83315.1 hypothetical protein SAMN05421871_102314 [Actinokineospora alba]SDO89397.1 hypothetical protein SAMN05192558_105264 [Actinokineospora alba]
MGKQPTPARRRGAWSGLALLISSLLVLAAALCPPHQDSVGAAPAAVEHHLDGCGVGAHQAHVPDSTSTSTSTATAESDHCERPVTALPADPAPPVETPRASLPRPSGRALLVEISVARS